MNTHDNWCIEPEEDEVLTVSAINRALNYLRWHNRDYTANVIVTTTETIFEPFVFDNVSLQKLEDVVESPKLKKINNRPPKSYDRFLPDPMGRRIR